jgi:hypothetical protein
MLNLYQTDEHIISMNDIASSHISTMNDIASSHISTMNDIIPMNDIIL